MPTLTDTGEGPVQLVQSRDAMEALGRLFNCVDEARWDSLARPSAAHMAALMFLVTQGLTSGLVDAGSLQLI